MDFIEKPNSKAFGGTCEVWLYDLANGNPTMPNVIGQQFESAITLPAGDWEKVNHVRWTTNPIEEPINGGTGGYRFSMPAIISKDDAQRINKLYTASRKNYLLKYRDMNGTTKLIGSPSSPVALLLEQRAGGSRMEDRNQMQVRLVCTQREPFAIYPF